MKTALGRKKTAAITFLGCGLFLGLWIYITHPFPDRDSVSQFYYPFLNYLAASKQIGNDFAFLKMLMPVEYPNAGLLLPAVLSAMGLQDLFIKFPWLINSLLILVFSLSVALISKPKDRHLIIPALFFFPITQIALKNFNLHSINVIFFFGGLLFHLEYFQCRRRIFLVVAACFFWYACAVKHMGVIFFLTWIFSLLIWQIRRRDSLGETLTTALLVLIAAVPFYPLKGFSRYIEGILLHNPSITTSYTGLAVPLTLFTGTIILVLWAKNCRGKQPLPDCYNNGLALLTLCILLVYVISLNSEFNSNLCMTITLMTGFAVLSDILRKRYIDDLYGLKVLFLIISLTTTLPFYFSKLAQVSMIFYPTLYIALILIFNNDSNSKAKVSATVIFILTSNFFPSLDTLETVTDGRGLGIYARGFNSVHQNPLAWHRSDVGILRDAISNNLTNLSYPDELKSLIMIRPHLHSYTPLELQFADNFLHDFPPVVLLEQLQKQKLVEIYRTLSDVGLQSFQTVVDQAKIPLILVGSDLWSEYLKPEFDLSKVPSQLDRKSFCEWFNLSYWKYLIENDLLDKNYRSIALGTNSTSKLLLFIHNKFPTKLENEQMKDNQSLIALKHKYRQIIYPEIIVADLIFTKASRYFDENKNWEASILLTIASQLDSEHTEIAMDLDILKATLNKDQLKQLKVPELLTQAHKIHPELVKLWNFKGGIEKLTPKLRKFLSEETTEINSDSSISKLVNSKLAHGEAESFFRMASDIFESDPMQARKYLMRVLSIEPNHKDAKLDLEILNRQLNFAQSNKTSAVETSNESINLLFKKSSELFHEDPIQTIILLKEVLRMDPNHSEAQKDLLLIKERLGINDTNQQNPKSQKLK